MTVIKYSNIFILTILIILLGGCSTNYNDYVYQRPHTRNIPEIPEIASVRVQPPAPHHIPSPEKPKVEPYEAKVHKYSPNKSKDTVITQKEVATVTTLEKNWENEEEKEEEKERERVVKKKAEVDIDPYADIPDRDTSENNKVEKPTIVKSVTPPKPTLVKPALAKVKPAPTERESSPAVKTLLIKARADLAIGRSTSAIEKLERGLRIEPRNANLWYQLAKTHHARKDYTQAISMAKKSIQNTNRDYVIAKNWMLIKKAGLKSGDTVVVKEAIDYFKVNP